MDQTTALVLLIVVAVIGVGAALAIARKPPASAQAAESPFAASTEGMRRCPNCGVGNLVTESNCSNCGKRLA
jgi:cytochrome c-type biogenesis protein CcmH/NrfF